MASISKLDSSRSRLSSIENAKVSNGFSLRRDHSMKQASREKIKKEISYLKIHSDFQKCTLETEQTRMRRSIVRNLKIHHPNIDVTYNQLMKLNFTKLNKLIEKKKFEELMESSAIKIQRTYRNKRGRTHIQFAVAGLLALKRKRREEEEYRISAENKHKQAILLQRYMKGYLVSQ